MNTKKILKESIIWLFIAIPIVYYFTVKSQLTSQIPIHFNIHGQPDSWTSPQNLLWLIIAMTLGVYVLMLAIPAIDPKRKIQQMGNKYYIIKLIMVLLMSIISIFIIYSGVNNNVNTKLIIMMLISGLFIAFGNYIPTVKPNYFIGVRTPWTLENEQNWKKTHRFTGWLWTLGGIITLLLWFVLPENLFFINLSIIIILAFIPIFYSFILYLKDNSKNDE